jgi:hypothetical protein
LVGIGFVLAAVAAELIAIMRLNGGRLVYALDDAYIHLAIGENLLKGHYGVNLGEFSAASSSILWSFIVAPFSSFEWFPLLFNIICALLTVALFVNVLRASIPIRDKRAQAIVLAALTISLTLATNTIGLIFMGMEHSLQLLVVAAVAWGLIVHAKEGRLAPWLLVAVTVAPLVRYENLAVSAAALVYLIVRKHYKPAIGSALLIVALVGGFSLFLVSLGLEPFPTSVMAKSSVVESAGSVGTVLSNVKANLTGGRGVLLGLGLFGLLAFVLFAKGSDRKRQLAAVALLAISLHVLVGKWGWYYRYEVYIWSFLLLVSVYLAGERISALWSSEGNRRAGTAKLSALAAAFTLFTAAPYLWVLATVPIASNNIYEQQYQMHRFAVDYYGKTVAVNDLGYVSYKNPNYVLDLEGLASLETFEHRHRLRDKRSGWMSVAAESKGAELVMIHEDFFDSFPKGWIKLGELRLGRAKITPAYSEVAFFAVNRGAYDELSARLEDFVPTLPEGVEFTWEKR